MTSMMERAGEPRSVLVLKPLLVGESNPYGDSSDFALYPEPRWSAGYNLCYRIMRIHPARYVHAFDRANLCQTARWSLAEARPAADRLAEQPRRVIVALGRRVATAFGFPEARFGDAIRLVYGEDAWRKTLLVLPHPSGRCREWVKPGMLETCCALLREYCPEIPFGELGE